MKPARVISLVALIALAVSAGAMFAAYRSLDHSSSENPFAGVQLATGDPRQAIVDQLGPPTEIQAWADPSFERLIYRRGEFSLQLALRDGQLHSWSENGPFRIRRQTEGKGGCCD